MLQLFKYEDSLCDSVTVNRKKNCVRCCDLCRSNPSTRCLCFSFQLQCRYWPKCDYLDESHRGLVFFYISCFPYRFNTQPYLFYTTELMNTPSLMFMLLEFCFLSYHLVFSPSPFRSIRVQLWRCLNYVALFTSICFSTSHQIHV